MVVTSNIEKIMDLQYDGNYDENYGENYGENYDENYGENYAIQGQRSPNTRIADTEAH